MKRSLGAETKQSGCGGDSRRYRCQDGSVTFIEHPESTFGKADYTASGATRLISSEHLGRHLLGRRKDRSTQTGYRRRRTGASQLQSGMAATRRRDHRGISSGLH